MRDYVFIPLIAVLCGLALRHPWMGVLAWTWLSVMNPHSYTWVAASLPVAAAVAGSTLIGMVVTRDERRFFLTPESGLLTLFMLWILIAYPFSFNVEGSYEMLSRVMKIDLMILVTLVLLQTRRQIELFVWVVVLSLGFYGIKGGIFTILSGATQRVWGPGGFIGGNNEMGLALIIVIPLMRYLQMQATKVWLKLGWTGAMLLTATAALGTQSRGAFLALGAMAVFLWFKSPRKFVNGIGIALAGALVLSLMSEAWDTRMSTITTYQQDGSAMGRINAWWMAWNLAKENITGGGFDIYDLATFSRYAPNPQDVHAAHSIYFQVLGEHGFMGLLLYLLMWIAVWRSASWLIRNAGKSPDTQWCRNLAAMCQVSLVGYAVGGAFLSLAYFDVPYDVLAVVVLTKRWLQQHLATAKSESPAKTPGMLPQPGRVEHVS